MMGNGCSRPRSDTLYTCSERPVIKTILRKTSLMFLATGLTLAALSSVAQVNLPDIGSPADAVLSKSEEARLGRAIMAHIRQSGDVVEDPLVTEYVNEIGHRIAAQANSDGIYKFTFFVVDNPAINAFALPGGFIGVHTGLLEATRNEDELAGVLAHEVSHVTQRHIARSIHANSRQSIMTMAIMLGAILAAAAGADGDVVQAGLAAAQGSAAQQQINFTRSNEYEADRVGIAALANAGFDPQGMASFFEVISRGETRPMEYRAPEFLRTHPVSSARIAEARSRARNFPAVHTNDTVNYGVARVRILIASMNTSEEAVRYFEREPYENQSDIQRYGRAVAYLRHGRNAEATRILEELANKNPEVIAYHIGLADAQLAMEAVDLSVDTFERARELFPRNVPLVIHYAEALLKLGQAEKAHDILLDLLNNVPPTPEQVRLIARAAIDAGEVAEAHYYMAEYRFMIGDLVGGVNFLRRGLQVPDIEEIQRIRFEARIDFIREFMSEEQLAQMARTRSTG